MRYVLALLAFSCATPAAAIDTGTLKAWKRDDLPVLVLVQPDVPLHVRYLVPRSFEYWNEVIGRTFFIYGRETPTEGTGAWLYGGVVVVQSLDAVPPDVIAQGKAAAFAAARTPNKDDGQILWAKVEVYPALLAARPSVIESVLRHEAGHVLGLSEHNPKDNELMSEYLNTALPQPMECSPDDAMRLVLRYGAP